VIRNALLVDAAIAVVLAILVIVLSPGIAVVGLVATLVVVVCGVSLAFDRRRRRRRRENPLRELRRSPARRASPAGQRRRPPAGNGSRRR
jgi:Flp pilus assembly protein TadB